ncbi:MAG TPA: ATP-binding cassette domain-containing protein [Methylomirabilota bacterium]|nr:ATP-binding cassette domain-containing protein [Methylomirabilota bacterium]
MSRSRLGHPLVILAAALAALPWAMRAIGMTDGIATEIAIFALVGLGFNLLLGYTGLVSFGHSAFFGLAAYGVALLQIHRLPGHVLLPMIFGTTFATALGLVIGFLALRRRGVYFSLLTLAFTAMIFSIVYRWTSFTGGENGLRGMTRPSLLGIPLDSQLVFYYVTAAIVLLAAWALWRVVHSPLGRVLLAIRDNERRARFLGYPVQRYKLIAFTLSAAATGLGGCLFAFLKVFVSADLVHVAFSGEILAMSIVGGMGHFLGPPLGGAFFILFREILSEHTAGWQFWFGLLFMGFILFSPSGLIGVGGRVLAPLRRRREEAAAMAARITPEPRQEVPAFLRGAPMASGALLECRGVSKRFGDFTAVAHVDLDVGDRTLHALIGPNGAGKTTLFNVVSGMYPPEGGQLLFDGRRLEGLPPERVVGHGVARSFQITNLFPSLTLFENLRLGVQARHPHHFNLWRPSSSLATVNEETRALVRFLGLEGVEPVPVASLSYGGQRLLELGLALAARPRLLLLDEPLAGLAAAERERVTALVRRLSKHMAVLLVEHDIDRVFAFADRITVMNEGQVVVDGPAAEVRDHPKVHEVYLGHGRDVLFADTAGRPPTAAGAAVLRVSGIDTFYGKSHILHNVSLELRAGEVVARLGRNGAGKSSTLKSVMGLAPPALGQIEFAGRQIGGHSPEEIARLGIGFVPQGRRLFPNLTVGENLELGRLRRHGGDGVRWEPERIFEFFPRIRERLASRAETLSGGEQQMVAIARALSGRLRLLLLDEPFEGLAPAVSEAIFLSIDRLRREVPILIVEHDLDLVLALADRVYVLDRGRITHEGPAAPLRADRELRRQVLWL